MWSLTSPARDAPAVLKNFVCRPEKTFSTVSVRLGHRDLPAGCPFHPQTSRDHCGMSVSCHVWTAPSWQGPISGSEPELWRGPLCPQRADMVSLSQVEKCQEATKRRSRWDK